MSTLHDVRYYYEHKYLPRSFFKYQGAFVSQMAKNPHLLHAIFDGFCQHNGIENPYGENQFYLDLERLSDRHYCLILSFPDPEGRPLCKYAYGLFNRDYGDMAYFTVEKGNDKDLDNGMHLPYCICCWTPEGRHINFGVHDIWQDDGMGICYQLYTDRAYIVDLTDEQS